MGLNDFALLAGLLAFAVLAPPNAARDVRDRVRAARRRAWEDWWA